MTKKTLILISFIILKFALQYILVSPSYDLQRDEYLHLDQANHLAWGFTSVPPVTSLISLLIKLLGNSVLWIRFFPALFGALTLVVVWKTIKLLKGSLFALILGATCVLFSVLLRLNILYQPNSLDVLCWTLFYFTVIKYFNSEHKKWLFLAAAVFALGLLNKYNMGFAIIGLLPALVLTKQRKLLTNKYIYIAALFSAILILPNMIWQYQNHFPVIHHMKELSETQLVHVDRLGFLKSQYFFFAGSFFVILFALWALLAYPPFQKYKAFFFSFFITLAVFLLLRAKDYYAIGIYPIYLAFGSVYLGDLLENGWKRYLQPVAILHPLLIFIPMYMYTYPNRSPEYFAVHQERYKKMGMLRWEDGQDHQLPQDYADMLGWRELAYKVDSVYSGLSPQEHTIVLCDNYGQAGAINFYSKKGIRAVSFNADYVNWFDFSINYRNLIRVKTAPDDNNELRETSPYFVYSAKVDSVRNKFSREYLTAIFIFKGAKIDINKRLITEVKKAKDY